MGVRKRMWWCNLLNRGTEVWYARLATLRFKNNWDSTHNGWHVLEVPSYFGTEPGHEYNNKNLVLLI
jgi:hypothetical protein